MLPLKLARSFAQAAWLFLSLVRVASMVRGYSKAHHAVM